MTKVSLGVTLPQFTSDPSRLLESARRAEELGLDSIWVFDHLWPLGAKHIPVIEAWTALSFIAAATERIQIGTLVTRSTLRHPALLARMAATVSSIAPGRLIVGLGSGDALSRPENEGFGIPYLEGAERIEQLSHCAEALVGMWTEPRLTLQRRFVTLENMPTDPRPEPRPPLWIGGRSTGALRIAASLADGYNFWGETPASFGGAVRRLNDMAAPREVVPTWGGQAILEATDDTARAKREERREEDYIYGSPATLAATLTEFVEAGARHLILTFPNGGREGPYERLAQEVRPLLDQS